MRERPIGDLVAALGQLGAKITPIRPLKEQPQPWIISIHLPPINIQASGLPGGRTEIAGNISSQFLSGLLMVAPYANNPVEILVTTELNSKPTRVDAGVMSDFGVEVQRQAASVLSFRRRIIKKDRLTRSNPMLQPPRIFCRTAILGGMVRVETSAALRNKAILPSWISSREWAVRFPKGKIT